MTFKKTFEKNNSIIVLYVKEKEICSTYISKINLNCEKQTNTSINDSTRIKNGWYYLAVEKLTTLLRGRASKHYGNFYCLNYLHSFRTGNELKTQIL